MRRARHSRLPAVLTLAAILVAFPLGVLASHNFADVPDSNPFHNDISALVAAGVTSGCGGGNYCPSANVTREQMAAFMNRLGALSAGKTPVVNAAKLGGLTASQFERSDTVRSGRFTCSGATMWPRTGVTTYGTDGAARYMVSGDEDFLCPILLPDGATVGSFQVGLNDTNATGSVSCSLNRYPIFATGGESSMADASSTTEGTSGVQVLEDTTVDNAAIDNDLYSYLVDCYISAPGSATLSLMGVSVLYEVTGLPLP